MNSVLTLPAPGKLNLFLHITGRREDGYHQLQTVFQLLDFGDQVDLSCRSDGQIHFHCDSDELGPAEDNLVVRAAHLLAQSTACRLGADIRLSKRLPSGGGLGGGSSDAATTLLGLNHLWQTGLSLHDLAVLGLQLGADVPVFIHGRSAWAEGIGEQLRPLNLPERWYLILVPGCSIATAQIFAHKDLTRDSAAITVPAFFEGGGHNDCQPVAASLFAEVRTALDWLNQHGHARLTGTGACVFADYASKAEAEAVQQLATTGFQSFVAQGINQSPVHAGINLKDPA